MGTFIRDKVLKKQRMFDDITSIYRRLSLFMYQGFVPNSIMHSDLTPELKAVDNYHEETVYDHKGNVVGKRKIDTLNIPKLATSMLRNLILGEGDDLSIDNDDSEEKVSFFKDILKKNYFYQNEADSIEIFLNTGDMLNTFALRKGEIKISYLNGFRFEVVEWEQGQPKSVVLYTERKQFDKKNNPVYYTLLELHTCHEDDEEETYYDIRREIYEGPERYQLERGINYKEHIGLFGNLAEFEEFRGADVPMFVFTRLPIKNNKQIDTIRGIGLMTNSIDVLRNLDLAYDANNREIELTKTQIIVPDEMLEHGYDKDGNMINHYNKSTRWYSGLNAEDGFQFNPIIFNPTIRQPEYHAKIKQDLDLVCNQIGLSPGTFSFESGGAKMTATQVMVQADRTHRTRTEIGKAITQSWCELIWRIYKYAKMWNLINWEMEYEDIKWELRDAVIIDDEALFQRDMLAVQAELMPKKEFLMRHYKLSDTEAEEWLDELETPGFGDLLDVDEDLLET